MTAVELEACESAVVGDVFASPYKSDDSGHAILATATTTGIPGCGRFRMDFVIPEPPKHMRRGRPPGEGLSRGTPLAVRTIDPATGAGLRPAGAA